MTPTANAFLQASDSLPTLTAKPRPPRRVLKRLVPVVLATASVLVLPAAPTLASAQVPFEAKLTQTATAAPCPQGAPASALCFAQTGTGTATHLGQMTKESFVVLTPVSATCVTFTENTVLRAANGDTLTAQQSGTSCFRTPTTVDAAGPYTITGGTGRFSGATGSGTATATLNVVAPGVLAGPAAYTGVLSSPGSLR